ncbi:MAG: SDR family oxidoreductase [Magnetococcales bacterium]|nr:SDR family oxidoreductase [Magnetococcales bacterium]
MNGVLRERVVVLTGATGGLGHAFAKRLTEAGCRLFLTGRHADPLALMSHALPGSAWLAADLTAPDACETIMAEAERRFGQVDVLINNAGIFPVGPFVESDPEVYETCFAVNVRAPIRLSRLALPGMVARGWGRLIHIGSSSAYAGFRNTALYCASKHALLGFSRSLHDELRESGVRSICLSPGSLQTPMGRQVPGQDFSTFIDPDDVAEYLVFLLSASGNMVSEEVRLNRVVIR